MDVYTDGSCLGNPGPGGWFAVCVINDKPFYTLGGGYLHTTNNVMELTAVVRAIERYGMDHITVHTDSKYVMDGITKWIHGWKNNGWKTSSGTDVKNKELWVQLDILMTPFVTFEWVKAHNGNKWNTYVDEKARELATLFKGLKNSVV